MKVDSSRMMGSRLPGIPAAWDLWLPRSQKPRAHLLRWVVRRWVASILLHCSRRAPSSLADLVGAVWEL